MLTQVPVAPASPERFKALLGPGYSIVEAAIEKAQEVLAGRVIWHINSTSRGGGVAEMLGSLLAYARGAGADVRWMVVTGNDEFFTITKRLHNQLHGAIGDGGELGEAEREVYERTLAGSARQLLELVGPDDIVYLHDPQTAGLTSALEGLIHGVVWRCHVGLDTPTERARNAWQFLRPYVAGADAYVFSREAFVWDGLDRDRIWIVPPSIDAFSPKNQALADETVAAILTRIGLTGRDGRAPVFRREDGTRGRVDRVAEIDQDAPLPGGVPLIAQISRWDRLKGFDGLLEAFAVHSHRRDAHLLLAGPMVAGVADDPEGEQVLNEIRSQRAALPAEVRARVHLACLPMVDLDENAVMVNAIQRRADVVVQKSIAEGFGLTVAEAMWKGTPVVASRIGGIQDQIVDGESGILIDDPNDLAATATAVDSLLDDPAKAHAMGEAGTERVRESYLGTRTLLQYLALIEELIARESRAGAGSASESS